MRKEIVVGGFYKKKKWSGTMTMPTLYCPGIGPSMVFIHSMGDHRQKKPDSSRQIGGENETFNIRK